MKIVYEPAFLLGKCIFVPGFCRAESGNARSKGKEQIMKKHGKFIPLGGL